MLISRTDVRQSDLSSSVLELLGGDKEKYQIIKELVYKQNFSHYLS